jgi:hypothetical protein
VASAGHWAVSSAAAEETAQCSRLPHSLAVSTEPTPPTRPVLRVVRGEPRPEELAALVAVLAARTAPPAGEPEREPGLWADRSAALRRPLQPGPGAWRAAALAPGTRTRAAP